MGLIIGLFFMAFSFAIIVALIFVVMRSVKDRDKAWVCPKCGFNARSKFCGSCGAEMHAQPSYGSFTKRLAATLIDAAVWSVVFVPVLLQNFWASASPALWLSYELLQSVFFTLLILAFTARSGQTPGKYLVGLRILTLDLKPIGLGTAFKRESLNILAALVFFGGPAYAMLSLGAAKWEAVGFFRYAELTRSENAPALGMLLPLLELLTLLTNKKRRALHDYIGGTVVVDEKTLKPGKVPLVAFKWWPFAWPGKGASRKLGRARRRN